MDALRKEAEDLAEQRRKAREEAKEWSKNVQMESDDERERKAKKAANRKVKSEVASADEGANGEGAPKKKRVRKVKKEKGATSGKEGSDAEDGALFSGGEEAEKPVKKVRDACLFALPVGTCIDGWYLYYSAQRSVLLGMTKTKSLIMRLHGRNSSTSPSSVLHWCTNH